MSTATFQCTRCKKDLDTVLPETEIVEGQTASLVVFAHPDPIKCPFCGQSHQFHLAKIGDIQVAFLPIKTESDARIIVPPLGSIVQ